MNRDHIVLGALERLGIPYDETNYEVETAYKMAIKEFEHTIEDSLQSLGSQYVNRIDTLNRATYEQKIISGITYYPYEIPNTFLAFTKKPIGNFFIANRYLYSDQLQLQIEYSAILNIQDLNFKFRKYLQYYLASELSDVLNRSSLKENLRQRAAMELEKINQSMKVANKDYYTAFSGGVELY